MPEFVRIVGVSVVSILVLSACGTSETETLQVAADRVFLNGSIYTVDERRNVAEAVAILDGKIVFVGSNEGAAEWIVGATEVTDLDGQMMLPGFHDSHVHLLIGVMAEEECDLLRIGSEVEVVKKLKACTMLNGIGDDRWIVGGGWGEWLWPDANPQKGVLDELFPDRPVYLESSFGHAAWVNSRALEIAGIDAETVPPPTGVIERDRETGEASGTLREAAMKLVGAQVPEMTLRQRTNRVRAAVDLAHSAGITSIIEPGLNGDNMPPILNLADTDGLDLRVVISVSPLGWYAGTFDESVFDFLDAREQWRRDGIDVDSIKIYMDGVIEYGTSPLLEPYEDEQYGSGEFFYEQDRVNDLFVRLDAMGLQIHVHAIGDAAIRRALDGFEAMREKNGMSDNRHQIVHLQLIDEADRGRFGALNIGAVFQLLWAYPDPAAMELDVPLLGRERAWQMYPSRSVLEAGGRIVGGSDYFVTQIEPLLAIETATTRQDPWTNKGEVLNADERLDLATMIEAYTINGAYQMKLEDEQGSIEVGKRADLIVLDRNLFDIPPSEISDTKITLTLFDGRVVYE